MDNLIRCRCPECSGKIGIPIHLVAKRVKCNKCNHAFVADLVFSPIESPEPPVTRPIPMPVATADYQESTPPPPKRRRGSPAAVPPPLPQPEPAEASEIIDDDDDAPRPITYKPQQRVTPTHASPGPAPKTVHFALRLVFRWVLPVLLATLGALLIGSNNPTVSTTALFLLISAPLLFLRGDLLARLLTAAWAPTYSCPGCHSVFEAVGRWNCACGYHDHKEQHFIQFLCPMCNCRLGHTNCERCDATIFLQWGLKKPGRG